VCVKTSNLPGGRNLTPVTLLSIGIPKAAKHPNEAWQVINYLTTADAAMLLATNRLLPAAHLNNNVLAAWAAANLGSIPYGLDALAGIRPTIPGRQLEEINNNLFYLLDELMNDFVRGRITPGGILLAFAAAKETAEASAEELSRSKQ
jgi:ABC-type glycerol-3-phosphate transport system substrate-binding protein